MPPPGGPRQRKAGVLIANATYEQLWTLYRDGIRTAKQLARTANVARGTATKAIKTGWPEKNWPALSERVKLWDRQRAEEEAKAGAEKFREQVDEFWRARRRNLGYIAGASGLAGAVLRKLHAALAASTFTKTRRVKKIIGEGADAHVVEVDEAYIPTGDVVRGLRATASAIRDLGNYERQWLAAGAGQGGGVGQPGAEGDEEGPPVVPLNAEQVAFIMDPANKGALPPNCTDEQVLATFAVLAMPADPKKG